MSEKSSLQDFENAIRGLAEAFNERIEAEMGERPWTRAMLDVRFARDGSFLDKIRVTTPGDSRLSLGSNERITLELIKLNTLRGTFERPWYGFALEVDASRNVTITYDYDPNCANDESFFAD